MQKTLMSLSLAGMLAVLPMAGVGIGQGEPSKPQVTTVDASGACPWVTMVDRLLHSILSSVLAYMLAYANHAKGNSSPEPAKTTENG